MRYECQVAEGGNGSTMAPRRLLHWEIVLTFEDRPRTGIACSSQEEAEHGARVINEAKQRGDTEATAPDGRTMVPLTTLQRAEALPHYERPTGGGARD